MTHYLCTTTALLNRDCRQLYYYKTSPSVCTVKHYLSPGDWKWMRFTKWYRNNIFHVQLNLCSYKTKNKSWLLDLFSPLFARKNISVPSNWLPKMVPNCPLFLFSNPFKIFLASFSQGSKKYEYWYKFVNPQGLLLCNTASLDQHRNSHLEDNSEKKEKKKRSFHQIWLIAFSHLIPFICLMPVLMDAWGRMAVGFALVTVITSLNNWQERGSALAIGSQWKLFSRSS